VSRLTLVLAATLAASTLGSVAPAVGVAPGVTTQTVEVTVGGRSFPARLSYPTRGGPYPALAFAHGFMARSSWYAGTLGALARAGYVVIAPDSETGPLPSHSRFADDLNRSLAWLAAGSGAPRGKVDGSRTAVAGHSMGGGVALLAASRSRTVDTVATLAAAETTPSAAKATQRLRVPSLFVVGTEDRIVPAEGTATMFDRAPRPSLLAAIAGGSHCGFMDVIPAACDAGRISYERQLALTREQLRRWLDRYLRGRKTVRVTGVPGILYERR
jgi:dienelactone hydrolase